MPIDITINGLSGASPFDIYLCDDPVSTCIYIDTISSTPYTFQVPIFLDDKLVYNIKVVDDNECVVYQNLPI